MKMHFKDKKTKSELVYLWHCMFVPSFPPVNNDAVKLSSELIYLFILGTNLHILSV